MTDAMATGITAAPGAAAQNTKLKGAGMPWVKFDERFPTHRKVRRLSDAAFRLHVSAIHWCSEHLTDGFVPASDLDLVSDTKRPNRSVVELETAELWEPQDNGWLIHDFLDYQPSGDKVRTERKAKAARQQRWRDGRRQSTRESGDASTPPSPDATTRPSRDASQDAAPSRTVPPPTSPNGEVSSRDSDFDRFYAAFPRHVGRKDAERKWAKAVKEGAAPEAIIEGAKRYAAERADQDARFTKHPATWLHQGCWMDEPGLRLVAGGYHAWTNPADPDAYNEELIP